MQVTGATVLSDGLGRLSVKGITVTAAAEWEITEESMKGRRYAILI
jgi:hypothetical protein